MRKVLGLLLLLSVVSAAWAQERQDTIVVSRDGTGNFRTLQEAIESARAFMDYTVTIYVKNGVYKEKVIVPSPYKCGKYPFYLYSHDHHK